MARRYFFGACGIVFVLIIILVAYGGYLNQRDEAQINMRMEHRVIPLKGERAKVRTIAPALNLDTINLYTESKTDVIAMIQGRVVNVHVNKNDQVKKGDLLFTLENEDYPVRVRQAEIDVLRAEGEIIKADNDIGKARTELARAKSTYTRYELLSSRDAVSKEKFEEVETAYRQAELTLANMEQQKDQMIRQKESLVAKQEQLELANSYRQVTAPIDGQVLILYTGLGSYVTAGTALALVGDFGSLYADLPMDDREISRFYPGAEAVLSFGQHQLSKIFGTQYEAGNEGSDQTFTARIVSISPSLDQEAAIRRVIWQIDNTSGLLEPQTYNRPVFSMLEKESALTVPLSAVSSVGEPSVFVWTEDGTLRKVNVTTGIKDAEYVEITGGLHEGDVVVTSGTNGLSDGMMADVTISEAQ